MIIVMTKECEPIKLTNWRGMMVRLQGVTTGALPGYVTVVTTPNTSDKASQMGKSFR
jgi:hypothetical protein